MTAPFATPFAAPPFASAPRMVPANTQLEQPKRIAGELIPSLRKGPTDDGNDHLRIKLVVDRWNSQDMDLIRRDRAVEEQTRALQGDMWSIYSTALGKVVNLAEHIGAPELLWRELPRVNLCQEWFMLTCARLTENAPVLGAEPRDSDSESIQLADAWDVVWPKLWDDLQMSARVFEVTGWMAAAGWSFHKLTAETSGGATVPMVGPATFEAPDGSPVHVEYAAFDIKGDPMGRIVPGADGQWSYELDDSEDAATMSEGNLTSSIPSPLECRGEWGNGIQWQQKRWHIQRSFHTQDTVYDSYGVMLQPDVTSTGMASGITHFQLRLERGPGSFGANDAQGIVTYGSTTGPATELCCLYEMWERPTRGFPEGRFMVVSQTQVLFDGPRPYPKLKEYGYTSPISYVEWLRQPGASYGSTPLANGLPINRQYNAGYRQLMLHRAKCSNPVMWYNSNVVNPDDLHKFGKPGGYIGVDLSPMAPGTLPPAGYIAPPPISQDVYKIQEMLKADFEKIMGLSGAEGIAQGSDASGEQVKELRFNSDRPISVPVKNLANFLEEVGNIALCMLPVLWPAPKMLHYMGDDNLSKAMMLLPEIWQGKCRVRVDAESMIPRSRQEREAQALNKFQLGVYGPPGTAQATQLYLQQSGFPDRDKAKMPGDEDARTMNYLIGLIMQGVPASQIAMTQQYNYQVMLSTLREHMASKEFLKEDPKIQYQMDLFWARVEAAEMMQALQQAHRQAMVAGAVTQITAPAQLAQAHVQGAAAQIAAPPAPPEPTAAD